MSASDKRSTNIISFFIGLSSFVLITCVKPERSVQIITQDAVDTLISYTTATLKGEIIDLGSEPIEDHGILVSENPNPIKNM